jgi:hypothetical protein
MISLGVDCDEQTKVLVSVTRLVCDGENSANAFDERYLGFTETHKRTSKARRPVCELLFVERVEHECLAWFFRERLATWVRF